MKFKYEKEDDIMMIELSSDRIKYAEQTGDLIVHFFRLKERPFCSRALTPQNF